MLIPPRISGLVSAVIMNNPFVDIIFGDKGMIFKKMHTFEIINKDTNLEMSSNSRNTSDFKKPTVKSKKYAKVRN